MGNLLGTEVYHEYEKWVNRATKLFGDDVHFGFRSNIIHATLDGLMIGQYNESEDSGKIFADLTDVAHSIAIKKKYGEMHE